MEGKPLNEKGPEPVKPADKPAVQVGPSGGRIEGATAGPAKPTAPGAKVAPPADTKKPPVADKMPHATAKRAAPRRPSKKKDRVTPVEASKLRAAIVDKLSKVPEGLRTADLAKALDISTSKLTFIASDLLKSGEIKKVEVNDRVVFCSKDAKVATPAMERDKIYEDVKALLRTVPKGMKIADIAFKTKYTRQRLAAALKPHIDAGAIKKVNEVYLLTEKAAAEPAAAKAAAPEKPAAAKVAAPAGPAAKPKVDKEPPKVAAKPPVTPAYRPPEKVKTGNAVAWLALIVAILSMILWLSVRGDNAATRSSLADLKQSFEHRTSAIDESMNRMYADMNAKLKTADMKVLNTFFNQQITDLEATLVDLDGLARMTNDEATLKQVREARASIGALIQQLKAEYASTVPE